jgi:sterol desaturase/sphingolipid hydroxylase (fatty acid hydroxylase superfamily)
MGNGKELIAFAIPFFFFFIGVELLVARLTGRRPYRLNDAYADLGCGITQQAVGVFYGAALLGGHAWIYEHARLAEWRSPVLLWTVGLVGVDFLYYWWHRTSHRVNALWMAHVVHHQSEDMNLAVALRQAPLTNFTAFPFYAVLAFVLPPTVLATSAAVNTLYQFWIHTELVPKLGPIEWVFNTPSHHRVHHGVNRRYIDKNYAGIFIVWDRLFGTFEEESERVVYGTVEPFRSFDPLWAQVHPWFKLAHTGWHAPRWLDKARIALMPPEWSPAGVPLPAAPSDVTPETRPKFDVARGSAIGAYVLVQLALTVVATFLLLLFQRRLDMVATLGVVGATLLTLFCGAALIEGRRWAWPLEVVRLGALVAGFLVFGRLA